MQNKIKKIVVIFPMVFLLCMSFIGINAKAADEVDKQDSIVTTSTESTGSTTSTETTNEQTVVQETLPAWKNIDGKLYYVTKDGISEETGWFEEKDENPNADNDNQYYLDKNHAATIGWKQFGDSWYYFNEAGIKQTGWQLINNNLYHLDKKGLMEKGWIEDDGKKYYLNDDGVIAQGKKYIEDNWYFFGTTGILQTGIYDYKGKNYYSNKDGIMGTNEWIKTTKYKYYVKADSSLATGNAIIDGVMEKFDSNSRYIGNGQMEDHLFIKYLNVGDADCAFIKLPSGETVLIDTGDVTTSEKVVNFLNEQDLKKEDGKGIIDYIIVTHAHSDHIGGLASILDNFDVKKVYIPNIAIMKDWYSDVKVTSENAASIDMMKVDYDVYNDAVKAMKDKNIKFTNTKNGEYIDKNKILQFVQSDRDFGGIGSEKISEYYWGLNDNSAVVYLNYGELQALFTGDMEWSSEKYFWTNNLLNGRDVDVLKVPHHGRDTSSTGDFISYLKPDIGIISRSEESVEKNDAYNNLISNGVSPYETSAKDGISIYATPENWTVQN